MKQYTIKIKPLSPFLTPVESDTLFGHLCWAMEYLGKDLTAFLKRFDGSPPLVMSGGFPDGYLPVPFLPIFSDELKKKLLDRFREKGLGDNFKFIQWLKALSRKQYLSLDLFRRYRGDFSKYGLYAAVLDGEPWDVGGEPETMEIYHNAINRISGQVDAGKFFSVNAAFYPEGVWLAVYVKTDYFTAGDLEALFGFVSKNGFGADKSTGSGRFDFKLEEGTPFDDMDDFNAYLLLSNTHPGVLKHYEKTFYTTQTKFGKLGGGYSTNAEYSPFKDPLILLNPGSVIYSSDRCDYLGENFKWVHPVLHDVRHYGVGFPVTMRLNDEV